MNWMCQQATEQVVHLMRWRIKIFIYKGNSVDIKSWKYDTSTISWILAQKFRKFEICVDGHKVMRFVMSHKGNI